MNIPFLLHTLIRRSPLQDRRSFIGQSPIFIGDEIRGAGNGPFQAPFERSTIEETRLLAALVAVPMDAGVEGAKIFTFTAGQCSSLSAASTSCVEKPAA
jgi:hypothetical protein